MSKPDLNALYEEYNADYFDGELPAVDLVWNTRYRTRGGTCHYKWVSRELRTVRAYQISINERLLADDPEGLRSTLIHEMVHVWRAFKTGHRCGHDHGFQMKMDLILGYRNTHRTHQHDTSALREKREIECLCPIHGVVAHRARMPRTYDMDRYSCPKPVEGTYGQRCGHRIDFVDTRPPKSVRRKKKKGVAIRVKLGGK
jgi:predicted SprT family Zn-dependent metalloprotease